MVISSRLETSAWSSLRLPTCLNRIQSLLLSLRRKKQRGSWSIRTGSQVNTHFWLVDINTYLWLVDTILISDWLTLILISDWLTGGGDRNSSRGSSSGNGGNGGGSSNNGGGSKTWGSSGGQNSDPRKRHKESRWQFFNDNNIHIAFTIVSCLTWIFNDLQIIK